MAGNDVGVSREFLPGLLGSPDGLAKWGAAVLNQILERSEQAFVLALMERVVQGISTRKVSEITEELCGASSSKSTVSGLYVGLDARVRVDRCSSRVGRRIAS